MSGLNLGKVRYALEQALLLVDQLEGQAGRRIDQGALNLLSECPAGLSTDALTRILRRRRQDVRATLKLMEAAKQIVRDGTRWKLVD